MAQVQILCLDATRPVNPGERALRDEHLPGRLVVWTKSDLASQESHTIESQTDSGTGATGVSPVPGETLAKGQWHSHGTIHTGLNVGALHTSSVTGEGIELLRDRLRETVLTLAASDRDVVAGTAVRCQESLRLASECLARALAIAGGGSAEELVAAEVRVALQELGKVVGAVYTDDVLDRIFSRFCVGK
jgi:tRNA U34 5-carboxymethylaminomethyl modifying GTPase MnmE/TrmE